MVDLPAPVRPTSAIVEPGRDLEVDVVQHGTPRPILERDVVETHSAVGAQRRRHERLHHDRRLFEHAGELFQGGGGGLEHAVELAEFLHRLEEHLHVEEERGEHTDGHLAVEHPVSADEQDSGSRAVTDQARAGAVNRSEAHRPDVGLAVLVVELAEDLVVAWLAAEGGDGAHAADGLDELHDDAGDAFARGTERQRRAGAEPNRQGDDERQRHHRHQRQLHVEQEHQHGDADQEQHRPRQRGEAVSQQLGERVDVGGEAADDAARRVALVETQAEALEVIEQALAQFEQHLLADRAGQLRELVVGHARR